MEIKKNLLIKMTVSSPISDFWSGWILRSDLTDYIVVVDAVDAKSVSDEILDRLRIVEFAPFNNSAGAISARDYAIEEFVKIVDSVEQKLSNYQPENSDDTFSFTSDSKYLTKVSVEVSERVSECIIEHSVTNCTNFTDVEAGAVKTLMDKNRALHKNGTCSTPDGWITDDDVIFPNVLNGGE